jgi:hypothetical protein
MQKSYALFVVTLSFLACKNTPENTLRITDAAKPKSIHFNAPTAHNKWFIDIQENTLNDTAKIGFIALPPRFNGRLYEDAILTHQLPINYKPYKANQGSVTIICGSEQK